MTLKKIFEYSLMVICLFGNTTAMEENFDGYDPTNRPIVVQDIIDSRFKSISSGPVSCWRENGQEQYLFFNFEENLMLKSIILDSPDQRIFYVLDIGGGLFQWGKALSKFIDNDKDLSERDFILNIINTGGEQYRGSREENTKKCKIYNLGSFKIENLKDSLNKEGLFSNGETFDLIVSSWCLRHLTDPMGTMIQAYNLLGPKRLMLFDGFTIHLDFSDKEHGEPSIDSQNCFLIKSFLDMNIPFLMGRYEKMRSLNQFIIHKTDEKTKKFPYIFNGIYDNGEGTENASRYYLRFKSIDIFSSFNKLKSEYVKFYNICNSFNRNTVLFGDRELFQYIENLNLVGQFFWNTRPIKHLDSKEQI